MEYKGWTITIDPVPGGFQATATKRGKEIKSGVYGSEGYADDAIKDKIDERR